MSLDIKKHISYSAPPMSTLPETSVAEETSSASTFSAEKAYPPGGSSVELASCVEAAVKEFASQAGAGKTNFSEFHCYDQLVAIGQHIFERKENGGVEGVLRFIDEIKSENEPSSDRPLPSTRRFCKDFKKDEKGVPAQDIFSVLETVRKVVQDYGVMLKERAGLYRDYTVGV